MKIDRYTADVLKFAMSVADGKLIASIKVKLVKIAHRVGRKGEHAGHVAYLALVSIGTPLYKYAAGVLLVFVIINLLAGDE